MHEDIHRLFSLTGRPIVVTGAGGLLGLSHSIAIGLAGGIPVMLDSNEATLQTAKEKIESLGIEGLSYNIDTSDEDSVARAAQVVRKTIGPIFGIINNVARNPAMEQSEPEFGRLDAYSLADWNRDHEVALGSAFLMSKHFGPQLVERGEGSVVNVASDLAIISPDQRLYELDGQEEQAQPKKPMAYSSSKSAVLGISRYLATYWSPLPIRSNALVPGSVFSNQSGQLLDGLLSRIPLRRLAGRDEYQGAIIFLLSDASKYMNGAIMTLDGGRSIW